VNERATVSVEQCDDLPDMKSARVRQFIARNWVIFSLGLDEKLD
jgi:hypothetical protein